MIPRARLDDIDEAVIQQLLANEVRESRTLDFKEQLDLTQEGRRALAEDICAFANTVGGDLVFGIREVHGVANNVLPVVVANLDDELLTLTNFLRDAVEPRVTTALLSHAVPVAGGHVVVLRVNASPNAPHRLLRNGQFYLRNSVGKETMDIHAIRTAFAFGDSLAERATAFRDGRLAQLRQRASPVPVPPGALVAVHVVPVLSLTRRDAHTVDELKLAARSLQPARPAGYDLLPPRVNYDGVVTVSASDGLHQHFAYAHLFRNGCIEMVAAPPTQPAGQPALPTLHPREYELRLVQRGFPAFTETLTALGIPAPAYLFVSLLRVQGHRVSIRRQAGQAGFPQLPPNISEVVAPPVYVEDFGADPATLLGPVLDVLWNAVGIDHTQTNFNDPDD